MKKIIAVLALSIVCGFASEANMADMKQRLYDAFNIDEMKLMDMANMSIAGKLSVDKKCLSKAEFEELDSALSALDKKCITPNINRAKIFENKANPLSKEQLQLALSLMESKSGKALTKLLKTYKISFYDIEGLAFLGQVDAKIINTLNSFLEEQEKQFDGKDDIIDNEQFAGLFELSYKEYDDFRNNIRDCADKNGTEFKQIVEKFIKKVENCEAFRL